MATTTNRQRLLTQFFTVLKKHREMVELESRPLLEQLVYGICRENTTRELADQAYENLRKQFFDWNEIRVSSIHEVEEALAELSEPTRRAERLVALLQEVFEANFSFDLESMHKKGVKQAVKSLARFQGVNDYTTSWATQQSLGGHAIPLDDVSVRVVQRLGMIDREQEDRETMRTSLEHLIPKAKGALFNELISWLGATHCHESDPHCTRCPLCSECPTGQENATAEVAAARATRSKPR